MSFRRAVGAAILVAALTTPATAQVPRTAWDSLARDLLRELVDINTTWTRGSTLQAAQAMAARLRAAGFPAEDVAVIQNAERKGNLVARLRGRQAQGARSVTGTRPPNQLDNNKNST